MVRGVDCLMTWCLAFDGCDCSLVGFGEWDVACEDALAVEEYHAAAAAALSAALPRAGVSEVVWEDVQQRPVYVA